MPDLKPEDVLYLVLREIGVEPSVESFDSRKRIQKTICILQRSGIPTTYGFNWYLQGPYSPRLAATLYQIATDLESFEKDNRSRDLTPDIQDRLEEITEFIPPRETSTELLEAVASILYLGEDWERIMSRQKSHLDDMVIQEALQVTEALAS